MIGETNINGGAGLNGKGALLKIKAETGSTITVSKGSYSKTIKVSQLDPDNNFWSYWFFQTIDFGEWTVMATAILDTGNETATTTVVIDSDKQYNIELIYNLWLIKDGIASTPFLLFHTTQSDTDDGIKFQCITDANDYTCVQLTSDLLQGRKYTHLVVDFSGTDTATYDHTWFGIASKLSTNQSDFISSVAVIQSQIPYIVELNISGISLTGNYFKLTNTYNGNFSIVRNIYFTRQ